MLDPMAPVSNEPSLALSELFLLTADELRSFYTPLENLDQNQDAELDYAEVRGSTLPVLGRDRGLLIASVENFKNYSDYLASQIRSRSFLRSANLTSGISNPNLPSAEDWGWHRVLSGSAGDKAFFCWGAIEFLDQRQAASGNQEFLIRRRYQQQGHLQVTLEMASDPKKNQVSVGPSSFYLLEKQQNTTVENLRQALLRGLCVYLVNQADEAADRMIDAIEGNLLITWPEWMQSVGQSKIFFPNKTSVSPSIAERLKKAEAGYPDRDVDLDFVDFKLPYGIQPEIYGEMPLSAAEKRIFMDALQAVPSVLFQIMVRQNLFDEKKLQIEVRETDLIDAQFGQTAGFFLRDQKKIVISRSYLTLDKRASLLHTLIHEFAHAADGWDPVNGFASIYFNETKKRLKDDFNPFVSPYASKTVFEFFAESIVAYLRGETDLNPVADGVHGPRDQAELRRKTPELYLALKLYLEPGCAESPNPHFGQTAVLSKDSLTKIKDLLSHSPQVLSPWSPLTELVELYSGDFQDCSDEVFYTALSPEF